jgi:hypothetical protein
MLGINSNGKTPSTKQASTLGRPEKEQHEDILDMLGLGRCPTSSSWQAGAHYKCPCGWTPPASEKMRLHPIAVRHWKACQGTEPPPMPIEFRKERSSLSSARARVTRRKKSATSYIEWRHSLKPKRIRQTACDLNFEDSETKVGKKQNDTTYRCRDCGAFKTPGIARSNKCRKSKMPQEDFLKAVKGQAYAKRRMKQYAKARKKQAQSEERREKQRQRCQRWRSKMIQKFGDKYWRKWSPPKGKAMKKAVRTTARPAERPCL